jgi:hypothetical protein
MAPKKVSKSKVKAKKGKRPPKVFHNTVSVAAGLRKAPAGEVTGHGPYPGNYACWNCGALNFVPGGIYGFYCWRCRAWNTAY